MSELQNQIRELSKQAGTRQRAITAAETGRQRLTSVIEDLARVSGEELPEAIASEVQSVADLLSTIPHRHPAMKQQNENDPLEKAGAGRMAAIQGLREASGALLSIVRALSSAPGDGVPSEIASGIASVAGALSRVVSRYAAKSVTLSDELLRDIEARLEKSQHLPVHEALGVVRGAQALLVDNGCQSNLDAAGLGDLDDVLTDIAAMVSGAVHECDANLQKSDSPDPGESPCPWPLDMASKSFMEGADPTQSPPEWGYDGEALPQT